MGNNKVKECKEIFSAIRLSENDMDNWHKVFEEKYPKMHQNFLEWLGLEEERIEEVRAQSR